MKMFINGKAVDSSDGQTIEVTNPATGEVIDTIPAATPEDIKNTVDIAKAAQKGWAKVPAYERAELLMSVIKKSLHVRYPMKQASLLLKRVLKLETSQLALKVSVNVLSISMMR